MAPSDLEAHILECERRFADMESRIEKLLESQERCTTAIERLTEDTEGVVDLYKNAQGVITVGIAVQKLGLWVVKWPIIGAGIYTIWEWVKKHQ